MKEAFEIQFEIHAAPENVFIALTSSDLIAEWCGSEGTVIPNGEFGMFDNWVRGKVLLFEPFKLLSCSWKPSDWEEATEASKVEYNFSTTSMGTLITLTHSQLPNKKEARAHYQGWFDFVLLPLKEYLEPK